MLIQSGAIVVRVLRQFRQDKRFLALALIMPLLVIGMLWVFFDAASNPFMRVESFVPALSAYLVHFLVYVLSMIVLVRERTQLTLSRMFVSGYRRASIIGGYIGAYTLLGTIQSLEVLLATNWAFEMGYSLIRMALMYGVIWLLAVASIAIGIFVSNFARNEGQVLPFVPLILITSIFFSGMIVPVDRLPDWIRWARFITPMYYANEAIQRIDGDHMLGWVLALAGYGLLVMSLAVLTLREDE